MKNEMPEIGPSDQELLDALRAGRREAFSMVVSRYGFGVQKVASRVLEDDSRAADVAQETFLELFRSGAKIKTNLGGWLYRVAGRRSVDVLRSERARRRREQAYQHEVLLSGPVPLEAQVRDALQNLKGDLREVLRDRYLERKSISTIAAEWRVSNSTVSRRVMQGLQEIRRVLRENGAALGLMPLHAMLLQSGQVGVAAWLSGLAKATFGYVKAGAIKLYEGLYVPVSHAGGVIVRSTAFKTTAAAVFAGVAVVHLTGDLKAYVESSQKRRPPMPAFGVVRDVEAQPRQRGNITALPITSPPLANDGREELSRAHRIPARGFSGALSGNVETRGGAKIETLSVSGWSTIDSNAAPGRAGAAGP